MSASSLSGTLIVKGHPGSEIRVLDEDFNLKGRGTVLLKVDLLPGLYIVNWKTAEVTQRDIVRVHEGRERIVDAPAPPTSSLTELPPEQETALSDALLPSEIHRGADVIVLFDGRGVSAPGNLGIRLYAADAAGTAMRSDRQAVRNAQTATGDFIARVYHVSPGLYRLQYRGTTGDTLTQSVPAMAGRQTVLLLRLAEAHVLVSSEEALETNTHVGVEAALSTIVSIAAGEPVRTHLEATRTASILLNDLANNRSSLGEDLMRLLEGAKCDPLLKLYAAAVIVNRLDLETSPTLDASYPTKPSERRSFRAQWLRRAEALLPRRRRKGVPDDFVVIKRRCAEELKGSEKLPTLASPPLLQVSWRWAIKGSFSNPRAIPESFSFRGVEQGAVTSPPWLVWRPAAAKAGAATTVKMPGLKKTLGLLAESTSRLISMSGQSTQSRDPLSYLPSDSSSLANTAFQVAGQGTRPNDLSQQVAETVQVSARTLRSAAEQALTDVNRAIETYQSGQSLELMVRGTGGSTPPPLRRPVVDPDDPQRARFGGQSEANGARLSATFKSIKGNADEIEVLVKATVKTPIENEVAEFFLHDSFEPNYVIVPLDGKVARLQFRAYGGFTVGAWLPSRSTELELDLQQAPKAPSIIRNR